jgi:hypothetical protein
MIQMVLGASIMFVGVLVGYALTMMSNDKKDN